MRTIRVSLPRDTPGTHAVVPILVDWFAPLKEWQVLENAIALANGQNDPWPNPNLISVEIDLT